MKTAHKLSIDQELWSEAKRRGINVSGFLEAHLREHLKLYQHHEEETPLYQIKIERIANAGQKGVIGETAIFEVQKSTGENIQTLLDYCQEKGIAIIH